MVYHDREQAQLEADLNNREIGGRWEVQPREVCGLPMWQPVNVEPHDWGPNTGGANDAGMCCRRCDAFHATLNFKPAPEVGCVPITHSGV